MRSALPKSWQRMAGVAAVVGNSHKALAPEIIAALARGKKVGAVDSTAFVPLASLLVTSAQAAPIWVDDRFAHSFIEDTHLADSALIEGAQTRPNLKIQEGCGNRCTFCVIPFTRGPSKSLARARVTQRSGAICRGWRQGACAFRHQPGALGKGSFRCGTG